MVEVRVIVEVIFGVEVRVRVKVRVMQYPTPSGYDFFTHYRLLPHGRINKYMYIPTQIRTQIGHQ